MGGKEEDERTTVWRRRGFEARGSKVRMGHEKAVIWHGCKLLSVVPRRVTGAKERSESHPPGRLGGWTRLPSAFGENASACVSVFCSLEIAGEEAGLDAGHSCREGEGGGRRRKGGRREQAGGRNETMLDGGVKFSSYRLLISLFSTRSDDASRNGKAEESAEREIGDAEDDEVKR
mgnify:CR=1 FL=1